MGYNIEFTKYAKRRMQQRQITEEAAIDAINMRSSSYPDKLHNTIYYASVRKYGYILLHVREGSYPMRVITAARSRMLWWPEGEKPSSRPRKELSEMKHEYDPEADAIYIRFSDKEYDYSLDLDRERRIDYAIDGTAIGVELLCVSSGVNLQELPYEGIIETILKERCQVLKGRPHLMGKVIYWHGLRFETGNSGKCPTCGHRTVCWKHLYMVEGYASFIMRIRREQGLDPTSGSPLKLNHP